MSLNDDVDGDVQVISTADAPPFDAVERNAFLSRLYYQLNVVLLDVRHDQMIARAVFLRGLQD